MAELATDAANELCNDLAMLLIQLGMRADEARSTVYVMLHGYQITKTTTDMTLYEGNRNEMLLKRFLVAKKVKGLSDKTLSYYYSTIGKVLMTIGMDGDKLTPDAIRFFVAKRMQQVSKTTCNNELRALSSFCTWLFNERIAETNPMLTVDRLKTPKLQKAAFSDDELEKMRVHLRTWREKALFELLLSTGCRVSEIAEIRREDIEGLNKVMVHGKGDKYREVYINARARIAVEQYLAERTDVNPYLFAMQINASGNFGHRDLSKIRKLRELWYKDPAFVDPTTHIGTGTIEMIVRKLGQASGVNNVHPHRFRRTCATKALRSGMPIELVSKMLGHANLQTTQIYLDISDDELEAAHRKYVT